MKVLSLFSGVGGFDLGLERSGMQTVFQCEWDKHATRILERHWPDVPRWTDVSTLTGAHVLQHAPVIDVVAWGSPCQDLSVAGKRAGLGGERSGLFHQGIRIIKEIKGLTNGQYPRISIWENVAGALSSSDGADFGEVLYEMDEAGACFSEWRMLDAQYFGVPQRRRRVFVISVFDPATAARCANPLLPVSESVCRDIEASGTERQEPTGTVEQSLASGRDIANTISAELYHKSTVVNQDVNNGHLIVGSLAARDYKGVGNQYVNEGKCVVETFTKAKRAQSTTDNETWVEGKPAPTLNAFDQGDTRATTVIAFENSYRDGIRIAKHNVSQTLSAKMGTGGNNTPMVAQAIPIQDGREMEKHQNGLGIGDEGAPSYTLDQTGAQAVAYAFDSLSSNSMKSSNPNSGVRETEIAKTLDTSRPDPSCNQGGIAITQPVAYSIREDAKANTFSATELDRSNALSALRPSPQSHHAQMFITEPTMAVRRLTPIECERLMGWPDDWTAGQADTHRYKQCGNGVASPVATWIGQQLINL